MIYGFTTEGGGDARVQRRFGSFSRAITIPAKTSAPHGLAGLIGTPAPYGLGRTGAAQRIDADRPQQGARPMDLRARYEHAVLALRDQVDAMRRSGTSDEVIARTVHADRLRLARFYKELTPEPYRTRIYDRTVRVYGNEDGPSLAFLRAKGKSWEAIIESATRPGQTPGLQPSQDE